MNDIFKCSVPRGRGILCVLGSGGDTKISWSKENKDEIENARETFNKLVKEKKFAAFSVSKLGRRNKKITEFDPKIQKLILIPPMSGGAFLQEMPNEQDALTGGNACADNKKIPRGHDEAEIKAMTLLKNKIGIQQFIKLAALRYIEVKGKYGTYKIFDRDVTLERTDKIGQKIRPLTYHLCVNVSKKIGYIPLADRILSLFLSIKENEDKFLDTANFRNVHTEDEFQERGATN